MTLVRRCALHGNIVETRNGVPFCPWMRGHYPEEWTSTDLKTGETKTGGKPSTQADVAAWRSKVGLGPAPKKPAVQHQITAAARRQEEPMSRSASVKAAAPPPVPRAPNPSGRKCGKCGAPDHDARNHDKLVAAPPAPVPLQQLPAPGKLETATPRAPERLVQFLYRLLREVPVIKLEAILISLDPNLKRPVNFDGADRHLEAYVRDLGERLIEVA